MTSHGDEEFDEFDDDGSWTPYESLAMRRGPQQPPFHMTHQMTTKVAPAYDGKTSLFAHEDAINDWCDITELEPEQRGPALRNRLEGEAAVYNCLLDRDLLRDAQNGVYYFERFLRPHFIKGAQNVFLYRFMQFMKHNRGSTDLQKWMTRLQITGNRLMEAWMDVQPNLEANHPDAVAFVEARRLEHEANQAQAAQAALPAAFAQIPWTEELARAAFDVFNAQRRTAQRNAFPLGDNLLALISVSLADLFKIKETL